MTWDKRNGMYYRSQRVGKRVIREYYGKGDAARLAAAIDACKGRRVPEDAAAAALERHWSPACEQLDRLRAGTRSIMGVVRLAAGHPRGQAAEVTMTIQDDSVVKEMRELARAAGEGEESAWPRVQRMLIDRPEIVDHFGDIGKVAADLWMSLYAGTNILMREVTRRNMLAWKESIAGPSPSPMETLLIDEVMVCWMQTHYFEMMHAQALEYRDSRSARDEAHRRQEASRQSLAESLNQLAELRRLLGLVEPEPACESPPPD